MSAVLQLTLFFLLAAGCVHTAKLPKYITPCKRYSEDLNECVKKQVIIALPYVLEGDKSLKLPNMKPFKLPEVDLESGQNLKIKMTDLEIYGLDNNVVENVSLDVKSQHFQLKILMNSLNLKANYEMDGRILVLPISGSGPCNVTFIGGEFVYDTDYELVSKKGKDYLNLKNPKLDYTTQREYYQFDNLFNGDQRLGDEMNRILNDNWQTIRKDFSPVVVEIVRGIATIVIQGFFSHIPYDNLLPPN